MESTAPDLKGPWSPLDKNKKYQQTDKKAEGPGVFQINNSTDWILMYDCYMDGYYQFCRSSDLEHFELMAQTKTNGSFYSSAWNGDRDYGGGTVTFNRGISEQKDV